MPGTRHVLAWKLLDTTENTTVRACTPRGLHLVQEARDEQVFYFFKITHHDLCYKGHKSCAVTEAAVLLTRNLFSPDFRETKGCRGVSSLFSQLSSGQETADMDKSWVK